MPVRPLWKNVESRVHRVEGRERAERVAADVARHRGAELVQDVEDAAVSAARAQHGRTGRKGRIGLRRLRLRHVLQEFVAEVLETVRIELEHVELGLVALHLDAERAHLALDERVEFLDHEHVAHGLRELLHEFGGEGVRPAELEDGELGEHFLHVLVCDAARDDADLLLARLDAVELRAGGGAGHFLLALLRGETLPARERGHGDRVGDVLHVGDDRVRRGMCAW